MKILLLASVFILISCNDGASSNKSTPQVLDDGVSDNSISCFDYCSDEIATSLRPEDSGYSYLSFPNFGHLGVGRCRGHALVTQKLSQLAYFSTTDGCDLSDIKCIASYKAGINNVLNFVPHHFSGFKSIYDLSSVPELKTFLRNKVASISHRYRAGTGNITITAHDDPKLNIFYELEKRILNADLPYVGIKGILSGAHALLLYDIGTAGKYDVLCARDPNIVLERAENCESYLYQEDGNIYYKRFDRAPDLMTKFLLTSDEDIRSSRYVESNRLNCESIAKAKKLCR